MNEKVIESFLLRNSKYSSAWIKSATKILTSSDVFIEEELAKFDAEQLGIIVAALEFNEKNKDNTVDIASIANSELNATQMQLMFIGQQNKIAVNILKTMISKDIPYAVSNYAVQGTIEGKDMLKYVHGYDPDQVYEIYAGLHNGLDVSDYDDASISSNIMGLIRHAKELGLSVSFDSDKKEITIK